MFKTNEKSEEYSNAQEEKSQGFSKQSFESGERCACGGLRRGSSLCRYVG